MFQRIDESAIVRAMASRLHDHVLVKAEMVAQGKQLRPGGVARRVLALGRERKFRARPEYMAVRIDCACRQLEARLRRAGIPVEPAGSFGETVGGSHFQRNYQMKALVGAILVDDD